MSVPDTAALYARYRDPALTSAMPLNPVLESMLGHRSVRGFLRDPLPDGALEMGIAAASSAPTSSNLQTWSVIAVEDQARRERLAVHASGQKFIPVAPLLLMWIADLSRLENLAEARQQPVEGTAYLEMLFVAMIDAALAAQNAVVAFESMGLARAQMVAGVQTPELDTHPNHRLMSAVPAASAPASLAARHEGPLDLRRLIEWLASDGMISPVEAKRTIARCAQAESRQAPLVRLANVAMTRESDGKPLDLEMLTQWLAGRAGLTYLRIDPLKVDVGKVADTMSAAYAERHKVLPVQVLPNEVVVATAEPFLTDWIAEVERQARRSVRRVVANPADIQRYTAEFFALAKSVRAAQKAGGNTGGASFEQLVELGKSNKQLDANDQSVVQVVDWLWQYAFDQRASDIHLEPRREQGVIRFRIDGILHPAYQMPMGVMNAMVARIKLLGRMDVVEKRRPLDGRIKTRNMRGDEVEMRLSTLPTAFGEKMV
eukprot:gene32768-43802_t